MTLETQISALVTSTASLQAVVNFKKAQLDASLVTAQLSETAARTTLTTLNTLNAVASTAANTSTAAASQANAALNAVQAAWASSTAPAEILPGYEGGFFHAEGVALVGRDTAEDSDGGVWRTNSKHTSWYKEELGGDRWVGLQASPQAAWTAGGSRPGAVFQQVWDSPGVVSGDFYVTVSENVATKVLRGISREWPASALVAAEKNRVVIYDASQVGCPMWKVIQAVYDGVVCEASQGLEVSSLALFEGKLLITHKRVAHDANPVWASLLDFPNDTVHIYGCGQPLNRRDIFEIARVNSGICYDKGRPNYEFPGRPWNISQKSCAIGPLPDGGTDACGLANYVIGVADTSTSMVFYPDGSWGCLSGQSSGSSIMMFDGENICVSGDYNDKVYVLPLPKGFRDVSLDVIERYGAPYNTLGNKLADGYSILTFDNAGYGVWTRGAVLLQRNALEYEAGMQAIITDKYATGWMVGSPVFLLAAESQLGPVTSIVDQANPDIPVTVHSGTYWAPTRIANAGSDVGSIGNFAYSRTEGSSRLEQAYNAAMDIGTGDFSLVAAVDMQDAHWQCVIQRTAMHTGWDNPGFFLGMAGPGVEPAGDLGKIKTTIGGTHLTGPYVAGTGLRVIEIGRKDGEVYLKVDGQLYAKAANTSNMSVPGATTTIGAYWHQLQGYDSEPAGASPNTRIFLISMTKKVPTAEQSLKIAKDIRAMYSSKALLSGNNPDVRTVKSTLGGKQVIVTTTNGSNVYEGLCNVGSSTPIGWGADLSVITPTFMASIAGWYTSSRVKISQLVHRNTNKLRHVEMPRTLSFKATAGQRLFSAPPGYSIISVSAGGLIRGKGALADYVVRSDGFCNVAKFATGLALDTDVQLLICKKDSK